MTGFVFASVLFAALLHASWNALVKSSSDTALDMGLIHLIGSIIAIPLLAVIGWPPASAWPFIATSVVIHLGYYIALTGAYQHGELGLTYPIMRGSAPVLVALASLFVFPEAPSLLGWAGILAVSAGVLALGITAGIMRHRRALGFALANAVTIALYTVVDGLGVRASSAPLQYVTTLFVLDGWPFALLLLAQRGREGRLAGVLPYAAKRWPVATGGALASFGAYGIALWAMTHAPVALVAALRESSVLFAALLGTFFLKEKFTVRRAAATCVIAAGMIAVRLG